MPIRSLKRKEVYNSIKLFGNRSVFQTIRAILSYIGTWPEQEPSGSVAAADNVAVALGRDLITNGDFANWTGDNPDGWNVSGEVGADPEISQVGSGEAHGGGGTGACNFFSSGVASQPRIFQGVASLSPWVVPGVAYRITVVISKYISGELRIGDSNTEFGLFSSEGTKTIDIIASSSNIRISGNGAAPHNITIDSCTVQQMDILASTAYPGTETLDESGASGTATAANWTTAWTVSNPSTGILRVTGDGVGNAYAWQTPPLTIGKRYRLQGAARSDGGSTPEMAEDPWAPLWTGIVNIAWQPIDVTYIATGTGLRANADNGATTNYSEFRNLTLTEANPLDADWVGGVTLGGAGNSRMKMVSFDGATGYGNASSAEHNSILDPTQFSIGCFVQKDTWDAAERDFFSFTVDANNWIRIGNTATPGELRYEIKAGGTLEQVLYATGSPTDIFFPSISVKVGVMKAWYNGVQVGGDQSVAGTFVGNFETMTFGARDTTPTNVHLGKLSYTTQEFSDELTSSQWVSIMQSAGIS